MRQSIIKSQGEELFSITPLTWQELYDLPDGTEVIYITDSLLFNFIRVKHGKDLVDDDGILAGIAYAGLNGYSYYGLNK